jgi:hypothetical protein
MKNAVMTAALMFAALGARAGGMPQMLDSDPLSRQILTKTAQANGGVTAAVRIGSGQVIELKIADVSSAPFAAKMAPAASATDLYLKPIAALAPKPVKAKPKKEPKRAIDQLKHVSKIDKNWR